MPSPTWASGRRSTAPRREPPRIRLRQPGRADPHQQVLLHTGGDEGDNTDTIMLVHISPGHNWSRVSIPRDTMVPDYECDSGPGYPASSLTRTVTCRSTRCSDRRAVLPMEDDRAADRHPHRPLHRDRLARLRHGRQRPRRGQRLRAVQRQRPGVRPDAQSASTTSPASRRWPSGGPARTSATAPTCSGSSVTSSCPPRW